LNCEKNILDILLCLILLGFLYFVIVYVSKYVWKNILCLIFRLPSTVFGLDKVIVDPFATEV